MANPKGMTRAQTLFLRAFRTNPLGPPAEDWPSPAVLRRWMRREPFRLALQSVRDAMRFQADLHLAAASAQAASALQQSIAASPDGEHEVDLDRLQLANGRIHALVQLLRVSHLRMRFTNDPPIRRPDAFRETVLGILDAVHPEVTIRDAIQLVQTLLTEEEQAMFRRHLRLGPNQLPPSRDPLGDREQRAAASAWETE